MTKKTSSKTTHNIHSNANSKENSSTYRIPENASETVKSHARFVKECIWDSGYATGYKQGMEDTKKTVFRAFGMI